MPIYYIKATFTFPRVDILVITALMFDEGMKRTLLLPLEISAWLERLLSEVVAGRAGVIVSLNLNEALA